MSTTVMTSLSKTGLVARIDSMGDKEAAARLNKRLSGRITEIETNGNA